MTIFGKNIPSAAFEKLYFDNYADLCRRIYRFVREEEIAKDIVQEVFLKYWQKMHELRIHESPKAYLYRACINQALNYLKERDRRSAREQTYLNEMSDDKSNRPDQEYIASETAGNIQTAIDGLPTACRNAFLLSRYEQKSYKEISELLDVSVNTVEKHIGKALKILREILHRS